MARPARSTSINEPARSVSSERAARLYHLLHAIADKPMTRLQLQKKLRLDVRAFYRDLELLRGAGIPVSMVKSRYVLEQPLVEAAARLPFPDPGLTLGEALRLSKGRTRAHEKLRDQIANIMG